MNAFANLNFGFFDVLSIFTYGLIAVSYCMHDIKWLRIITVVACSVDVYVYYNIRQDQPMWVQILMNALFVLINAYQLFMLWKGNLHILFNPEEQILYRATFSPLTPSEFKRLLQLGKFRTLQPDEALQTINVRSDAIYVIVNGGLSIMYENKILNKLGIGNFAGEMSYLTNSPASANVTAEGSTRIFEIKHEGLDFLRDKHADMHIKLTGILGCSVVERLRAVTPILASIHPQTIPSPVT